MQDLGCFFRQAQEPSKSRDCPLVPLIEQPQYYAVMTFRVIPLNSVATEPHEARLPRFLGPSSPDLFLRWETTHRHTARGDPVDEIWRLMAIAVCLGNSPPANMHVLAFSISTWRYVSVVPCPGCFVAGGIYLIRDGNPGICRSIPLRLPLPVSPVFADFHPDCVFSWTRFLFRRCE